MKKTLSLFLAFLMALSVTVGASTAFAEETITINAVGTYGQSEARAMLDNINAFRTGTNAWYWNEDNQTKTVCTGLSALTYDYDLEKTAMLRAAEIALSYSHTRPNGERCFTAYSTTNCAAGENIAAGYRSADAVFVGWREDNDDYAGQGHRRNMLSNDYTAVGIGHYYSNGYHYWVQEFRGPIVDANETPANDAKTVVPVEVATSNILDFQTTLSTDSITLKEGKSAALPQCSTYFGIRNNWPTGYYPVTVDVTYDVANPALANVSGAKLIGTSAGSTKLTVTATYGAYSNTLSADVTIQHDIVKDGAVPATFKKAGKTEGSHCKACGKIIKAQKEVAKLGAPSLSKVTAGKKQFTATWKSVKHIDGYQIQYSTDKNFKKGNSTVKVKGYKSTAKTVKKLKAKKKYYVRIRGYKTIDGKKQYSAWSAKKSVTTKK